MSIQERFETVNGEYGEFEKIENKLSSRPDIHAFILLNELFPGGHDIVAGSGHDIIFLDTGSEDVKTLSDEHILELTRCGVMYNDDDECLTMFT